MPKRLVPHSGLLFVKRQSHFFSFSCHVTVLLHCISPFNLNSQSAASTFKEAVRIGVGNECSMSDGFGIQSRRQERTQLLFHLVHHTNTCLFIPFLPPAQSSCSDSIARSFVSSKKRDGQLENSPVSRVREHVHTHTRTPWQIHVLSHSHDT